MKKLIIALTCLIASLNLNAASEKSNVSPAVGTVAPWIIIEDNIIGMRSLAAKDEVAIAPWIIIEDNIIGMRS